MDEETRKLKVQEYSAICAKIGEDTIIILNNEIEIAELQRQAKEILKEIKDVK